MLRFQHFTVVNLMALLCAGAGAVTSAPGAQAQTRKYTDQQVSDHIEDELLMDHAVMSAKIDVSTTNGIVTLTGSVDNILAKERAARIAETVKGVRSVINRIKVKPSEEIADLIIRNEVTTRLSADPATDSWEIMVKVNDGVVTLTGNVDSWQERELAAKVAKGAKGVTDLKNNITVDYDETRSDKEIQNDITQALLWDIRVDSGLVTVKVNDGRVRLSGTVGSAAEKRIAQSDAWVAGVKEVNADKLKVERWARDKELRTSRFTTRTSDEIREAIEDAMLYDPRVMSFNVEPEVAGSLVTLRGKVDNLKAKQAAEQVARRTVGVTMVTNRIKVRPEREVRDDSIETSIRRALKHDPYVDRREFNVIVTNGVAYLYGTVDSYFEEKQAKDVASRVYGVVSVEDRISVDYDTPTVYDPYVDDIMPQTPFDSDSQIDRTLTTTTDEQIKKDVTDEFYWSPYVDANQVKVTVNNGTVRLSGTVNTQLERDKAAENAWEGGATWVVNELKVK